MTVQELWNVTTCEIFLEQGTGADGVAKRVKLPTGGRLLLEHAEQIVTRITPIKRASESPYLLVDAVEVEE